MIRYDELPRCYTTGCPELREGGDATDAIQSSLFRLPCDIHVRRVDETTITTYSRGETARRRLHHAQVRSRYARPQRNFVEIRYCFTEI